MKFFHTSIKPFTAMLVGLAMLCSAPASLAAVEIGEGLTLDGDVRFRYEIDSDDAKDKDRDRQRVRLRLGGNYQASDAVSIRFRLETGSATIQSQNTTLEVANAGKNADFGLGEAHIFFNLMPVVALLGKWASPLYNPGQFIHDADINFEGLGVGYFGGSDAAKFTALAAYHLVGENGFNDINGDSAILTWQLILNGGEEVAWKVAAGANHLTLRTPGESDVSQTYPTILAEITLTEMNALTVGGGYTFSSGDIEGESKDENALMAFIKAKVGAFGLGVTYYEVGGIAALINGAAAHDNFPFAANYKGFQFKVKMPKFLDAVKWDVRYYTQETLNDNFGNADSPGFVMVGPGRNRNRAQVNFTVGF